MPRTLIPVVTANGYARHVTDRQTPGEIAGRVLPRHLRLWRTAVKRTGPHGPYWFAHYVEPKNGQVQTWENRPRATNHTIQREFAH